MNTRFILGTHLTLLAVAGAAGLATACGGHVLSVGATSQSEDGGDTSTSDVPWYPNAACTPLGSDPKILLQERWLEPRVIVPDGDRIWFGAEDSTNISTGVTGLYSVPMSGGLPAKIAADGFRDGTLTKLDDQLVYVRTVKSGGSEVDPGVELVTMQNATSGESSTLANPRTTTYVDGVVAHATGIYWGSREYRADKPSSISRRDLAGKVTELTTIDNYSGLAVDGKELFYIRYFAAAPGGITTEIHVEAVSIEGGTPRVIKSVPYTDAEAWQLVGVDGGHVYLTRESVNNGTIGAGDLVVIDKDGSHEHTVITGQGFSGSLSVRMDADWIYWVDQAEQNTIVRVRKTGGPTERIVNGDSRWVSTLAVDACNVYWVVENPPAIYGRSH